MEKLSDGFREGMTAALNNLEYLLEVSRGSDM